MDITQAFRYIFEDKQWLQKILIGSVLSLFSIFLIPGIFLSGYLIKIMQQVKSNKNSHLPEWNDWPELFNNGLNLYVANLVYSIPILFLSFVMLSIGLTYLHTIIGIVIIGEDAFQHASDLFVFTSIIFVNNILFRLFQIIFPALILVYMYCIFPSMTIRYVNTNSIVETLNVKEVIAFTKNNLTDIAIIAAVMIAVRFVAQLGLLFFIIGIFITGVVSTFVYGHLLGQLALKATSDKNINKEK